MRHDKFPPTVWLKPVRQLLDLTPKVHPLLPSVELRGKLLPNDTDLGLFPL